MRKALKSFVIVVVLFFALLLVLLLDLSPNVKPDSGKQVDHAESVQVLFNQVRQSLRKRYSAHAIDVTNKQASSLAGFLQRARDKAAADVGFSAEKMQIQASYRVFEFPLDLYVNVHIEVSQGQGINVTQFHLGKIALPGNWALAKAEALANAYTQSVVATRAINTVEQLEITNTGVTVSLRPMDGLLREFKNIKTGGSNKDTRLLKIRIAHYLRFLNQLYVPPIKHNQQARSLAYYLRALMQEAHIMSQQGSATLENEAAILAITIYAGSPRFATLVGDLSFAIDGVPTAKPKPVLFKRKDLSLHFVFSAAIKLLSEKGVSVAVGEFKELMDRGQGGSGYSFIDLAADLSGANFAALAVNPKTAEQLQQQMRNEVNEQLFMVSTEALEEGLSKQAFENKYTKVDSPAYNTVVDLINQRIKQLPINRAR